MPSWKKIIASGSDAELNSLTVTENVTASSLTGSLETDIIQFTAQTFIDGVEGQLGYSFDNGKLTFYTENDTPIELGRSIYVRVRNADTVTLTKGTVVDFTEDNTGQTPRVKRAIATSGTDCSCFVGVIIKDTPINQFGYIMLTGVLDGLNLSTFTTGDQVYLSQTVSGSFSTTIPTPPVKAIRIGKVLNAAASPTQGVLFIRPENRTVVFELEEFKQTYNTGSFSGSFTGDLEGTASFATTASYALFALSASNSPGFTTNHTQLTASTTWSFNHNLNTRNPIVQVYDLDYNQIIPNEIVGIDAFNIEIRFDYTQAGYAVASNGGGLYVTGSTPRLVQTEAATTWSFQHNLGTKYPGFEVFDENDFVIIPAGIYAVDENNAEIYFATPSTGVAIANFSGISGSFENTISASFAATASYSDAFSIGETLTQYSTIESSIDGTNTVFDQATGSYTSAFFKYTVTSGSNARSGEIMSVWNGTSLQFTDNSTTDIGTTTDVTSSVDITGANVQLNMQTNSAGWRIKSLSTFM